jgi:Mor family transcriptional regulator
MPWDDAGDDDIVADILRRLVQLTPGFSAAVLQQVERDIRAHWGGDRPYIARRAGEGTSARNEAIRRDHQAGERTGLLCRRYRLTPRQIQRILRREPEEA